MSEITVTWIQTQDIPFGDAEFYEPGTVAVVELGDERISIDSEGDRRLYDEGNDRYLRTATQFREAFPDGIIASDGDGWVWESNDWFDLYDADGEHLDRLTYTLDEALAEAEAVLRSR